MRESCSDALRDKIAEILRTSWDPLRVGNCLEARDEYRSYVKGILKMILEQRDAFAIRKYLREAESGMLAGLVNEKRIELVVGLLTKVSEARQS